jgi:hypothetical protein
MGVLELSRRSLYVTIQDLEKHLPDVIEGIPI